MSSNTEAWAELFRQLAFTSALVAAAVKLLTTVPIYKIVKTVMKK